MTYIITGGNSYLVRVADVSFMRRQLQNENKVSDWLLLMTTRRDTSSVGAIDIGGGPLGSSAIWQTVTCECLQVCSSFYG